MASSGSPSTTRSGTFDRSPGSSGCTPYRPWWADPAISGPREGEGSNHELERVPMDTIMTPTSTVYQHHQRRNRPPSGFSPVYLSECGEAEDD